MTFFCGITFGNTHCDRVADDFIVGVGGVHNTALLVFEETRQVGQMIALQNIATFSGDVHCAEMGHSSLSRS